MALLIGGLDPTGQAGLARDIVAVERWGVRAAPVATGVTVQDSERFEGAHRVPFELVVAQGEAALREHEARVVKVGALLGAEQVEAVARLVEDHGLSLVLDPVVASSSGGVFLDEAGERAMRDRLLPLAALVTPNAAEASRSTGAKEPHAAARALVAAGAGAALVTRGGHAPDLLFDGASERELPVRQQPGHHRGTGCRLAGSIAALLTLQVPLTEAVAQAHGDLQEELRLDAADQALDAPRAAALRNLRSWFPRILAELRPEDVAEVGVNVAFCIDGATDPRTDVVGLAGRITQAGPGRAVSGRLAIGGPHHTGRLVVAAHAVDPAVRIAMNHAYRPGLVAAAEASGLTCAGFRRDDEPEGNTTMEWGVTQVLRERGGRAPDLVWDAGAVGKEPMIRILATTPEELHEKLSRLHGDGTDRVRRPIEAASRPTP